ncbi:MAG: hypothetical protein ACOC22_04480 [bacterium]
MSVIKKYSYLRVIIIGIPFGLLSLISGIKLFGTLTKVNELEKVDGIIKTIESKDLKRGERTYDLVEISLKNGDSFYSGEFKHEIVDYFNSNPSSGKSITIWHETGKDYIKQLSIDNNLLFEYSPPYWIAHFFLWLGIVTLMSALIYVIKHPEDLFGKKKT